MTSQSEIAGHGAVLGAAAGIAAALSGPVVLAAFDLFPHAMLAVDGAQRVRWINKRMETLCGIARQRAIGLPCAQVLRSGLCVHGCPANEGAASLRRETDMLTGARRKIPVAVTSLRLDGSAEEGLRLVVVEDLGRVKDLEKSLSTSTGLAGSRLLGRSREMERLLDVLPVIAQAEAPVLITGETGTGKDLVAESLHAGSPRSREAFARLSAGPMSEELLDSELFGHVKGAFAWADTDKVGRIQAASGGTIYVAELADLPLPQQAGLLRLLDERVVVPVGAEAGVRVDVRIMAATHRSPEELVRQGRLREDLLHRLAAVRVHLPPLRDRAGDVEFLLHHFLEAYAGVLKKKVTGFTPKALRLLADYSWPGNVRELKNVVEYAVMICQEARVLPAHLPMHVIEEARGRGRRTRGQSGPGGEGRHG